MGDIPVRILLVGFEVTYLAAGRLHMSAASFRSYLLVVTDRLIVLDKVKN